MLATGADLLRSQNSNIRPEFTRNKNDQPKPDTALAEDRTPNRIIEHEPASVTRRAGDKNAAAARPRFDLEDDMPFVAKMQHEVVTTAGIDTALELRRFGRLPPALSQGGHQLCGDLAIRLCCNQVVIGKRAHLSICKVAALERNGLLDMSKQGRSTARIRAHRDNLMPRTGTQNQSSSNCNSGSDQVHCHKILSVKQRLRAPTAKTP